MGFKYIDRWVLTRFLKSVLQGSVR
jgi:hypothetical protein